MQIDPEKILLNAIQDGLSDGIKDKFKGYNSPLDAIVTEAIARHKPAITDLISESIGTLMSDDEFRASVKTQAGTILSKLLVSKLGGELEKQVNVLKSDPTTRAKITLAIDAIISGKT